MSDSDTAPRMAAAAVLPRPRNGRRSTLKKVAKALPTFFWFLIFYVVVELSVPNVRSVIFTLGSYSLTWVEVMYLIASFLAMGELLRVSKPGVDNTVEALWMLGIGIIYLVLFLLGITKVPFLRIFSNTEFLMISLLSFAQIVLAFMINARTLKRTIDYSHDDAGGDHYG